MEKVRLGRTGLMVTKTSFGALPIQRISKAAAVKLVRRAYEALKAEKAALQAAGQYRGEPRRRLACRLGVLLGYPEADCLRMIGANADREAGDDN